MRTSLMRNSPRSLLAASVAALIVLACAKKASDGSGDTAAAAASAATPAADTGASPAPSIFEREWALITLGDSAAPAGAGGKPATIHFESAASRASGFAGCNRYTAPFTMAGDSLHIGLAAATKMACVKGDKLERALFASLPKVTGYEATDSTLTLTGSSGALAGFKAQ